MTLFVYLLQLPPLFLFLGDSHHLVVGRDNGCWFKQVLEYCLVIAMLTRKLPSSSFSKSSCPINTTYAWTHRVWYPIVCARVCTYCFIDANSQQRRCATVHTLADLTMRWIHSGRMELMTSVTLHPLGNIATFFLVMMVSLWRHTYWADNRTPDICPDWELTSADSQTVPELPYKSKSLSLPTTGGGGLPVDKQCQTYYYILTNYRSFLMHYFETRQSYTQFWGEHDFNTVIIVTGYSPQKSC